MTKLLTIDLRSTAPRMLGSRGTPSQFVLYSLKNLCAKFDAFTRFVTIFPLTDRTIMMTILKLDVQSQYSLQIVTRRPQKALS